MLAPEGAASGAPNEFPLDTGETPEVELLPEGNEQDLDQVQASPPGSPVIEGDGAVVASEAEIDGEVESEHPLAYRPISSVLARPTILRPAVTGYPTFGNSSRQSNLRALLLAAVVVLKPPTQLSLWSRPLTQTRRLLPTFWDP